ncbi:hypothetical protein [Tengunoibacter tsumagoiensis]|uniref:Uncharacterized protein n=1 Tax=Tengunoibacter tsumagoiensis TaxID=2014871 RepID=A0A402A8J2_9CHLR|nr:hypothetical protein [Tengunoibacter tsumagoiensis]GCE15326.1 hypothetical protein KTT_51850 [Tengunoibacter tsumagoiensis]
MRYLFVRRDALTLKRVAIWVLLVCLFYLVGPVLVRGRNLQRGAAGPLWNAEKRWFRIYREAFISLLWYAPLFIFFQPLSTFWSNLFQESASWLHLSILAILGTGSLFPPTLGNLSYRWCLCLPLAPVVACIWEKIQPNTTWIARRILTDEELTTLKNATDLSQQSEQVAKLSTPLQSSAKKPRAPRKQSQQKALPPATAEKKSLWEQIDWSQIPDTNPVKIAAMQELNRREEEKQTLQRDQWLQEQAKLLDVAPVEQAVSLSIAEKTVPSEPETDIAPKKGHNWDEGEGSIREL